MRKHRANRRARAGLAALAAAAGWTTVAGVSPASAQQQDQPLGDAVQECRCDRLTVRAPRAPAFFQDGPARLLLRGAYLGVVLGEEAEADGVTGVRVVEVPSDGPAARAGVQPGDIIVTLDESDLDAEPALRIREILAEREPGDTVRVSVLRDGARRTLAVETGAGPRMAALAPSEMHADGPRGWAMAPPRNMAPPRVRDVRRIERIRALAPGMNGLHPAGPGRGLQLVAMNDGLGRYFDTSEGVLVVAVPDGSGLELQAGDVILSIDQRQVEDPAHVRAILGSYREDETLSMEVVRQGRRITVSGTVTPR